MRAYSDKIVVFDLWLWKDSFQ